MKIAIDARAWEWTGVGRYIQSIVREYARIPHRHTFTLVMPQHIKVPEYISQNSHMFTVCRTAAGYYSLAEQTQFLWDINRIDADIFHFPHFNIPLGFRKPYVVTIHDTTRFVFAGQRRKGILNQLAYEMVFMNAIRRARSVICVSKYTDQEVLHLLSSKERKLVRSSVIYEGVDETFFQPVSDLDRAKIRALIDTKQPYLLYVGVWMSHKNLPRMLQAFKAVKRTYPDLKLVMTGKPVPSYTDVLTQVRVLKLEKDVVFPGFVSDALLPALYAESRALLFPSLYEGFGLPALEAAAVGTPVIAANVTSLPEIMGDAARYINPEHVASISDGIVDVLRHENTRQLLIEQGRRKATEFRWSDCAQKTLAVYKSSLHT